MTLASTLDEPASTSQSSQTARVRRPPRLLTRTELRRSLLTLWSLPAFTPLLLSAPRGDGHPVLALPGFMGDDATTRTLRRYLTALGYDIEGWNLGRNLGPKAVGDDAERLSERIAAVKEGAGRKVSLIGWSLGGAMAHLMGQRHPDLIRQVITLGSPLRGHPKASTVWRLYEWMTGQEIRGQRVRAHMEELEAAPRVPTTAIFSKGDGVVPWQNCRVVEGGQSQNLEVVGSHCSLGFNASVLYAVADRLAQAEGAWAPFAPGLPKSLFYP